MTWVRCADGALYQNPVWALECGSAWAAEGKFFLGLLILPTPVLAAEGIYVTVQATRMPAMAVSGSIFPHWTAIDQPPIDGIDERGASEEDAPVSVGGGRWRVFRLDLLGRPIRPTSHEGEPQLRIRGGPGVVIDPPPSPWDAYAPGIG